MSNTLDAVLPVRMPAALAAAVRKAAELEGSDACKVARELFTGYAIEAGTLAALPRRVIRREKVA
jgi:hypothetical protein